MVASSENLSQQERVSFSSSFSPLIFHIALVGNCSHPSQSRKLSSTPVKDLNDPPGSCFPCRVCACLVMAFLMAFLFLFCPFVLISALCVQHQSFHSRVLHLILIKLTHFTCLGNTIPTTTGLIFSISPFQSSKTILNVNTRLT